MKQTRPGGPWRALPGDLRRLLSPGELRRAGWLGLALALMGALELLGLALVPPFLALALRPEALERVPGAASLYALGGFARPGAFVLALGLALLLVLIVRNLYFSLVYWLTLDFVGEVEAGVASRLLGHHMARPYTFFLRHPGAELASGLLTATQELSTGVFLPAIFILSRVLSSLLIVGFLYYLDPWIAGWSTALFCLAYLGLALGFRGTLSRLGALRRVADERRFKYAQIALHGIKTLRAADCQAPFQARFEQAARHRATAWARSTVLSIVPRYALELLGIAVVLGMILLGVGQGRDPAETLPLVGSYVFAASRLLPSLQEIYHQLSTIRFSYPALAAVVAQLPPPGASPPASDVEASIPFQEGIELEGVRFSYPGSRGPSLDGVDLRIPRGTSVALVGTTGSGKTTLVDLLLGLLEPEAGEIRIDGRPLTAARAVGWRRRIGYVPQEVFLVDESVTANIALGVPPGQICPERVRAAARAAQLEGFIEGELPAGYETLLGERGTRLSGGQRQRIGIARALYRDPDLLVLDEATSALDSMTERRVLEALRGWGRPMTVLAIAHRLSTVERFDQIHALEGGRVVASGRHPELLESCAYYRGLAHAEAAAEPPAEATSGLAAAEPPAEATSGLAAAEPPAEA